MRCWSFFCGGRIIQRASQQNDDGFSTAAMERNLQIAGIFNLTAKLTKVICHRVDNILAAIRDHELHAAANHLRMTKVHQLSSNPESILQLLTFGLEIDLIRVGPIEHLSDAHGGRACSCRSRPRETVL